jgi:protein-tyrosine kinase
MSHIDKALRAWEDAAGLRPAEIDVPRAHARAFSTFGRENLTAIGPDEPVTPAREVPVRPAPKTSTREAAPIGESALHARLVTGSLDGVGLEQYRRLAASLHDAQAGAGLKTVMVTSALPREGKTLTTANLGLTLSNAFARRVLIIDADLRWPSMHTLFGVPSTRGLSETLADDAIEPEFVSVSERLSLLTAGQPGPTPLAGLSSTRMQTLLEQFGRQFDWVLIDTPPVGLLPDAHLLARLAGAVVLVIGAGSTPSAAIERVVTELGPECIIGTVLNRVENHRIAHSGYYDRDRGDDAEQ